MIEPVSKINIEKSIRQLFFLTVATLVFNLSTGIISVWYGNTDRSLALSGFGIANFLEIITGIYMIHFYRRMQKNPNIAIRDKFEDTALRLTGILFYMLTAIIVFGAGRIFYFGYHPRTAVAAIIIAGISAATMYGLHKLKSDIGKKMNSVPIIADAEHSKTNYYLSVVLLGASLAFELADVPYIDIVGGLGIGWFCYQEGKESLEKFRKKSFSVIEEDNKDIKK